MFLDYVEMRNKFMMSVFFLEIVISNRKTRMGHEIFASCVFIH